MSVERERRPECPDQQPSLTLSDLVLTCDKSQVARFGRSFGFRLSAKRSGIDPVELSAHPNH